MAAGPHVMVAEATFYPDVLAQLVSGATAALDAAGASYERFQVPGAFEVPAAISVAAGSAGSKAGQQPFDGYLALGCVIRGETSHYDHVCGESARALQSLAYERGLAIGFGILTVENRGQAMQRADPGRRDTGGGAARACLEMIKLKQQFASARQ